MTMPTTQRTGRPMAALFPLAVGIAAGLLVAGLAIPGGVSETGRVTAGAGDEEFTAEGDAGDSIDGGGGALPEGQAGDASVRAGGRSASGAGGPSGRSGSGSAAQSGGGDGPAGEARGVTNDRIKIGIAIPDIGPFAVVDEFNLGDMRGHMEAVLDRWKREGRVPVHGRQVEFVYRVFGIVGDEDVASCNGFVKDDRVFMVIGLRSYEGGNECLADRFDTPVVTLEHFNEEGERAFQRMHPYLFTLRTSLERIGVNLVRWAHAAGHLKGKTIGIYSETPDGVAMDKAVTDTLTSLGYKVAARSTTSSKQGGADDQVAVQRFRVANVNLALLFVAALPATSFMEQARAQGYRPTYLDTDYGDHTSDAASSTYPVDQYDGTLATSMTRVGDLGAGRPLAPEAESCVANYERYSGRRFNRRPPETAEMVMMLQGCDEAEMVITALERAGRNLTRSSFIAAMDSIERRAGASHASFTFTADKHHGAASQRTVQWQRSCECWVARSEFADLLLRP